MDEKNVTSKTEPTLKERFANFAASMVKDVSITNQDFFSNGGMTMTARASKITPRTEEEAE